MQSNSPPTFNSLATLLLTTPLEDEITLIPSPFKTLGISPTDTYVTSNLKHSIENRDSNCAGIISVINKEGNQWSFAKIDRFNKVTDVAEKQRISSLASTGIYYFSNGYQFVKEAERIITLDEKTQGEFYVIPIYQKLINKGYIINIDKAKEMWDLGTPESISVFKRHLSSGNKP